MLRSKNSRKSPHRCFEVEELSVRTIVVARQQETGQAEAIGQLTRQVRVIVLGLPAGKGGVVVHGEFLRESK